MSTPDLERPDIVEQARAALSDWHEACARMDEVDADPDLGHEDRRHAQDTVTEAALEAAWLLPDLVAEAERLRGELHAEQTRREIERLDAELHAERMEADLDAERSRLERAQGRVRELTADLAAIEAEEGREDVRGKHWVEVIRVRREKNLTIAEIKDGMDVLARAIGYSASGFPDSTWPHLDSIGEHTLGSLAVEAAGHIDRARDFAARLEVDGARLTAERDGARGMRVIATRAFETTRRVLQEASGLPDDIDDPDCRDEMVLALRPRAEKAEAEVARLREGIEALSDEMQSDTCPACHAFYADEGSTTWGCDHTEGMQHAGDMLRALLAEGGE